MNFSLPYLQPRRVSRLGLLALRGAQRGHDSSGGDVVIKALGGDAA